MVQFPTITRSQQLLTKPTKIFLIFTSSEYAIVLVKRWDFIKCINFPVNKFKFYSVQPSYMYTSSIALRRLLFFDELVQTSSSSDCNYWTKVGERKIRELRKSASAQMGERWSWFEKLTKLRPISSFSSCEIEFCNFENIILRLLGNSMIDDNIDITFTLPT